MLLRKSYLTGFAHCNPLKIVGITTFTSSATAEKTEPVRIPQVPSKGDISSNVVPGKKMSKAMAVYLERSKAYNEFIKKEEADFHVGKRHLANMMGVDVETFTQKDIDEAIEYLFPSGIYDKKARPFMKPPKEVFPPKKEAQFDETGRPFHFLFFTGRPNFYNILHDVVMKLKELDVLQDEALASKKPIIPPPLDVSGSNWMSKAELEASIVEDISDKEYGNFLDAMERLQKHPFAVTQKQFILSQRTHLSDVTKSFAATEPFIGSDGRSYVTTHECPRKSARATVTVIKPGTGLIDINKKGIDHFSSIQARNQILFPLELSGLRNRVDVVATVNGGGETGQAGAIRYGIAWGIRTFVSQDVVESMRLAGLLTKDFRRKERKKPGQEGARRKYTWKKR